MKETMFLPSVKFDSFVLIVLFCTWINFKFRWCSTFIFVANFGKTLARNNWGRKCFISSHRSDRVHPWGKLRQELMEEPETEAVKKPCVLAGIPAHAYLAFICSLVLPDQGVELLTVGWALLNHSTIKIIPTDRPTCHSELGILAIKKDSLFRWC